MWRISVLEFGLAARMHEPNEKSERSVPSLTLSGHGGEVVFHLWIQAVLQTVVTGGLRTTTRIRKFHNARSIHSGVNSMSCKKPTTSCSTSFSPAERGGVLLALPPCKQRKMNFICNKRPFIFKEPMPQKDCGSKKEPTCAWEQRLWRRL